MTGLPGRGLDFSCVLVTGGGGGIGKALARYFVSRGKKVIIAGCTESKLRESLKEIDAAAYYVLDTGHTSGIPGFVATITADHPDLDCLVNNAGGQRPIRVLEDDVDFLAKADQEIDINIRGPMHLAISLLPHLQTKPAASIMNVSSVLGFVPFSDNTPVYNATKAWLHSWTVNLRSQLKNDGSNIRIVEISPPLVESDLHRDRPDPDDNKKANNPKALTMRGFMDQVSPKLERGEEMITAGMGNDIVAKWYQSFGNSQ